MPKFKLYAGLGGGFGGAHYCGTYEFKTQEEADRAAYELARKKYENYKSHYDLDDWERVYADCADFNWIAIESWIIWYAKEVDPALDWHSDDDDDADCYCE